MMIIVAIVISIVSMIINNNMNMKISHTSRRHSISCYSLFKYMDPLHELNSCSSSGSRSFRSPGRGRLGISESSFVDFLWRTPVSAMWLSPSSPWTLWWWASKQTGWWHTSVKKLRWFLMCSNTSSQWFSLGSYWCGSLSTTSPFWGCQIGSGISLTPW